MIPEFDSVKNDSLIAQHQLYKPTIMISKINGCVLAKRCNVDKHSAHEIRLYQDTWGVENNDCMMKANRIIQSLIFKKANRIILWKKFSIHEWLYFWRKILWVTLVSVFSSCDFFRNTFFNQKQKNPLVFLKNIEYFWI